MWKCIPGFPALKKWDTTGCTETCEDASFGSLDEMWEHCPLLDQLKMVQANKVSGQLKAAMDRSRTLGNNYGGIQ